MNMIRVSGGLKMESVEKWRKFFKGAGTDICSLIEYAILVAASDCPNEFRRRRDRIAQRLYTSRFIRCGECDAVSLAEPHDDIIDDEDDEEGIKDCQDKDNDKVNSSTGEADGNRASNYSYDEAEALTEEIEEESQVLREVCRIKDILGNPDESDSQLYECLRRLELMQLTVETLKATEIGKQVNLLRKHNSKEIRSTVKRLISGWKELVDEWVKTAGNVAVAAIAGTSPDSVSLATADDENGLPSPPLDEGAFLATQTTSIEISQIFDGMDDDGNPRVAEKTENDEYDDDDDDDDEKQCIVERPHKIKQSAHQSNLSRDSSPCGKQETNRERGGLKRNVQIQASRDCRGHRMSSSSRIITSSGPGRPPISSECRVYRDNVQKHTDLNKNQTKPNSFSLQNHKSKSPDDASVKVKLEAAKRRLQEGYQQVENAKKQRTVQVMELQDLPKQGPKPFHGRPVSQHHRQWMNNRRQ